MSMESTSSSQRPLPAIPLVPQKQPDQKSLVEVKTENVSTEITQSNNPVGSEVQAPKKQISSPTENQRKASEDLSTFAEGAAQNIRKGHSLRSEVKFALGIGSRAADRSIVDGALSEAKALLKETKKELKEGMEWHAEVSTVKDPSGKHLRDQAALNVHTLENKVSGLESMIDQLSNAATDNPTIKERIVNFAKSLKKESPAFKTPLPQLALGAIWHGSLSLKIPGFSDSISRSELKNKKIAPEEVRVQQFQAEGNIEELKRNFRDYSVYPTYPTQPVELTAGHREILEKNKSPEAEELRQSAETGSPLYVDLTPGARKLFNEVNFSLVQNHLTDTAELANATVNKPDLSHLGMDYFETEVYDTLARGLAFIDKDVLSEMKTIKVPVKQLDGTFELKEYEIERFNISGQGQIDHKQGHPIFFLKPTEGSPPMIVARGTLLADDGTDGAKVSVQADGRKDISLKWIMENPELKAKMEAMHKEHGPFKVCGHSLGGNIALHLSVRFFNLIDTTTTISAPHVSKEVYEEWKKIPEENRPKVLNICVEGDLVPGGGDKIMGLAVLAEQKKARGRGTEFCNNPVERHLKPFNNGNVRYAAINKDKETDKVMRGLSTFGVSTMGRFVQKDRSTLELIMGTGKRDEALTLLADGIKENLKPLELKEPVTLATLERASPSQIKEFLTKNPGFLEGNITPELFLKIYIAFGRQNREIPPQFQGIVELYNQQRDR